MARQAPIKLVAVFPPGGSVDQVARILARPLQQQLGQTVVVDNKGGASGSIGTGAVAAAPPDGYTFARRVRHARREPGADPEPAVRHAEGPRAGDADRHLADGDRRARRHAVQDVRRRGRRGEGRSKDVSYGTIGSGSLGHLAMALLAKTGRLDLTHIPYKGGGPLMNDAIAGHVPLAIGSVFLTKPHVDSGRLRALAVTSSKRSPQLPDVPTVAERASPASTRWPGGACWRRRRRRPRSSSAMHKEITTRCKQPGVREKLAAQGMDVRTRHARRSATVPRGRDRRAGRRW